MSLRASSLVPNRTTSLSSPSTNRDHSFSQFSLAEGAAHLYAQSKDRETRVPHNGTATYIIALPAQLWTKIFILGSGDTDVAFNRNSMPRNLTQTCRLWRAIALTTPILWNKFSLFRYYLSTGNFQLRIARANANGHPLRLQFHMFKLEPFFNEIFESISPSQWLWRIILAHPAQLGHVHFSQDIFLSPVFSLSFQPEMFLGLKSVEWVVDSTLAEPGTTRNFERFWDNACSAPLLQQVKLERIPRKAPWSQLTQLHLSNSPYLSAIDALRQCQNLTKLYWFCCEAVAPSTKLTPILLPKLVDFTVSFGRVGGAGTVPLLEYLSLPSLSHLTIEFCDDMKSMLESLRILLTRSNATLKHFEVPLIAHTVATSFVEFLATPLLNNLRNLFVKYCFETPGEFCKMLEAPSFLPCVEELNLRISRTFNEIIRESLKERQRAGSSLIIVRQLTGWVASKGNDWSKHGHSSTTCLTISFMYLQQGMLL